MTTKKQAPEVDPILSDDPTVTIAGAEYTIRRLGLRDVFKVARILGRGVAVLGDNAGTLSAAQTMQVLISSLTANEDEVLSLLADVLSVKRTELENPALFPMDSIIDVLQALAEHQDLKAFLARVQRLTETLPEMQNLTQTR